MLPYIAGFIIRWRTLYCPWHPPGCVFCYYIIYGKQLPVPKSAQKCKK